MEKGTIKRIHKIKKRYLFFAVLFLLLVYILSCMVGIWNYADVDETRDADVAVILGAATYGDEVSPVFRERINHGIWLYRQGYVKAMIITGGYGTGNSHSDAYVGKKYAMEQGVPEQCILLEEASTITEENLENAKVIMGKQQQNTALIVSDPLHMKRAMLQAKDKGMTAYSSPTRTSMYRGKWVKLNFLARETFFYVGYQVVHIV